MNTLLSNMIRIVLVIFPVRDFYYVWKITLSSYQILQIYASLFEAARVPRSLPRCSYGKNYCET